LENIISSFKILSEKGLPLGNLTSQLFVNVYMNEFDQFIKHKLKASHYIRYADDFILLHHDKEWLEQKIIKIENFIKEELKLNMNPEKISIKTLASGVDFLGWVHFPDYKVLRMATKNRMFRNINKNPSHEILQSYLGLLLHGNAHKLEQKLLELNCDSRGSKNK